jgi:hypothetical protein
MMTDTDIEVTLDAFAENIDRIRRINEETSVRIAALSKRVDGFVERLDAIEARIVGLEARRELVEAA